MENKGELYGDEEYSYDNYEYIQPDWRAYYNATDKNFISESLFEMGYDIFTSRFIDALVDSESLILLRPEDIRSILRDVPIGIIVKFEKRFNEWKKAKLISEETQSIESSQHQINLSQSSNLTDLNTRESINTILMSSDEGIRFLSTIDKSKKMSVKQQEQFMSLICSYYLKRNIDIKLKDIDELSKIINDEFPMEPVSAYFNKETRTGPLYTKLNNMKSLLRSKHLLPPSRKRKAVVEKSRPPTLCFHLTATDDMNHYVLLIRIDLKEPVPESSELPDRHLPRNIYSIQLMLFDSHLHFQPFGSGHPRGVPPKGIDFRSRSHQLRDPPIRSSCLSTRSHPLPAQEGSNRTIDKAVEHRIEKECTKPITSRQLKFEIKQFIDNAVNNDSAYRFMSAITGSPAYFERRKKDHGNGSTNGRIYSLYHDVGKQKLTGLSSS
ncbi:hypothetical protein PVAND_005420 [Polypedilum vanderplanki]|uniref:Uncharacterized protein n=1 Tax=Polypedilum vanderplanki TaxID=319348 RepID=A0A9J6C043_POLVA|nr:hypothetical protein PVAND_005420 [Polypedilum vanderplanki]